LADDVCGSFLARGAVARAAVGHSLRGEKDLKAGNLDLPSLRFLALAELDASLELT
jgi:hypothetical protein